MITRVHVRVSKRDGHDTAIRRDELLALFGRARRNR